VRKKEKRKNKSANVERNGGGGPNDFNFILQANTTRVGATQYPNIYDNFF